MNPQKIIDKIAFDIMHGKESTWYTSLDIKAEGQPGVTGLAELAIDKKHLKGGMHARTECEGCISGRRGQTGSK